MLKKQRNYKAVFEIGEKRENERYPSIEITIEPPFTMSAEIDVGISRTTSNIAKLQFINLSEDVKNLLYMDMWNRSKKYVYLELYAGYGDTMPVVFKGDIFSCTSYKEGGSTDFITEMMTTTGYQILRYGYVNATFTKGTKLEDIIRYSTDNGKYAKVGHITPDISPLKRDKTFIGQPLDIIQREYGGYSVYVYNDEINILGDRDVVPGEVLIFSDKTGLLGSPRRGDGFIEWDSVFEPQIQIGQAVVLNSSTMPWLNRAYKVLRVVHKIFISNASCGKATTSITANIAYENESFNEVKKETNSSYTAPPTPGVWIKPVKGVLKSSFGKRLHPIDKVVKPHDGIDIGCDVGTDVKAVAPGKIMFIGTQGGYGYTVIIDHGKINGKSVYSWYSHLSKFVVNDYQNVSQGFVIAKSGGQKGMIGSGKSTGPHLHFAIQENGTFVNPENYIGKY